MRHRQRHLHATIVRHLTEQLTSLGWVNAPVNFAAAPITILGYEPQAAGKTPAPNTVAISIEDQGEDEPFELGGLESCNYTLFVDIYGQNEPVGIAIADDVKDSLTHAGLPLLDFTHTPTPTDEWIEFEHVLVENIPSAATTLDKRTWRAVKATAVCFF